MDLECGSLKRRIKYLEKNLDIMIYQKYIYDPYHYHLRMISINNTIEKIEKLEKKFYNLCENSQQPKN